MKIIGIAGPARAGKNTVGNYLRTEYAFTEKALAYPIKEMVMALLEVDHMWLEKNKDTRMPNSGTTPRKMMQTLGTEWGRNTISEDIWVNYLLADINSDQQHSFTYDRDIVVTDVRFPNEAKAIRDSGGWIWHVFRPTGTGLVRPHASEKGLRPEDIDHSLFNEGNKEDLYKQVDRLMALYSKLEQSHE